MVGGSIVREPAGNYEKFLPKYMSKHKHVHLISGESLEYLVVKTKKDTYRLNKVKLFQDNAHIILIYTYKGRAVTSKVIFWADVTMVHYKREGMNIIFGIQVGNTMYKVKFNSLVNVNTIKDFTVQAEVYFKLNII